VYVKRSRTEVKERRKFLGRFIPNQFFSMVRRHGTYPPGYRLWKNRRKSAKQEEIRRLDEAIVSLMVKNLTSSNFPATRRTCDERKEVARVESALAPVVEQLGFVPGRIYAQRPEVVPIGLSTSAREIFFRKVPSTIPDKYHRGVGNFVVPDESCRRLAVIIPSGEGKTWLACDKKTPGMFFDGDEISTLPKVQMMKRFFTEGSSKSPVETSTFGKVQATKRFYTEGQSSLKQAPVELERPMVESEFYVDRPDFSGFESKVLLVRTMAHVPEGFGVVGAFALCECPLKHPHTDELFLPRKGRVRFNEEDRSLLPVGTTCCSSYDQRNMLVLRGVSRYGVNHRWASVRMASRLADEAAAAVKTEEPTRTKSWLDRLLGR